MSDILSLDIGSKRIGVARASTVARIAEPLTTLDAENDPIKAISQLVAEHDCKDIVVGLPRNMSGQETAQTESIRKFAEQIAGATTATVYFQDESLTSVKAEELLEASKKGYTKGSVDAQAAVYILEDYLLEHQEIGSK